MLSRDGRRRPDDSSFVADANTVAESRTSKGQRLRVSFKCDAPPSSSYLYYDFPERSKDPCYDDADRIKVVAAHGELVLLKISNHRSSSAEDYFVYRPAGARRPPSLFLLPVLELPTMPGSVVPASYFDLALLCSSRLDSGGIGLLRRGENDILVVHVDLWYDRHAGWEKAVFSVLRSGLRRWELMKPVPVFQSGWMGSSSVSRNVICVGGRFLCCIWYGNSFLMCDMADEASPKVRHIGLPPEVRSCTYGNDDSPMKLRRMGAAGDDSTVRFISIHPHCCFVERYDDECCGCGRYSDREECLHPRFVFTIKTWTMDLSMEEPLEWVEDGEIDSEELWALPGCEGLPPVFPEWPVVCLGKANIICFTVSNYEFTRKGAKVWMVHLNVKTKTLLSVVQLDRYGIEHYHLPAEFQY